MNYSYSCAPNKIFDENSCFSIEDLQLIAKEYNKEYESNIDLTLSKKLLIEELTKKFSNCSNQYCWLSNSGIKLKKLDEKYKILNNTFRPFGPSLSNKWLSTNNINQVMKQYEKKYSDFKFIGAVPYDFKYIYKISKINFNSFFDKQIFKLGMVINMDPHDKPGSHWVSLFFDIDKKQIYYFDSNGESPRHNIRLFITKIVKYYYEKIFNQKIKSSGIKNNNNDILNKIDVRINSIRHQLGKTECGVYSINFIARLLNNESFLNIVNNISTDKDMLNCRKVYFN